MYPKRTALLLDGAFVIKQMQNEKRVFPSADLIVELGCAVFDKVKKREEGAQLFRIYFYDAPPFKEEKTHPVTKEKWKFAQTQEAARHDGLLQSLELKENFAVRRGDLQFRGWKLTKTSMKELTSTQQAQQFKAEWFVPAFEQKGVDMRIGLDIAWISLKKIADIIVLVTGDSDFIPAMKFARKEGVRVYLEHLGNPVKTSLKVHADVVL